MLQIKTLLLSADGSAKQADACLDFRRPDLAYSEYLKASNILLDLVPRHKDFPALCSDKGELWRLNKGLQNVRYLPSIIVLYVIRAGQSSSVA